MKTLISVLCYMMIRMYTVEGGRFLRFLETVDSFFFVYASTRYCLSVLYPLTSVCECYFYHKKKEIEDGFKTV